MKKKVKCKNMIICIIKLIFAVYMFHLKYIQYTVLSDVYRFTNNNMNTHKCNYITI